jgi:hypothetical protein
MNANPSPEQTAAVLSDYDVAGNSVCCTHGYSRLTALRSKFGGGVENAPITPQVPNLWLTMLKAGNTTFP